MRIIAITYRWAARFALAAAVLATAAFSEGGEEYKVAHAKIQSIFIWNFSRQIEWPDGYRKGDFVIAVMGNPYLKNELMNMSRSRKVGDRAIRVLAVNGIDDLPKCNILYISPEHDAVLRAVADYLKGKSTLIVTEKEGMAREGAVINFVAVNNKQKFELNVTNAERHNLKISSQLSALAILVK